MADWISLVYLIEGTSILSSTTISYSSSVNALRGDIFQDCREYYPSPRNLCILKINVDPDDVGNHLPLLQFNKNENGVEELSPSLMIGEVWPEPPPPRRIHVFVTFTGLPPQAKGWRSVLKTAHLVYYKFWGKTLDDILQPVGPDCDNLKYLSQNQIGPLNLRSLLYTPNVLLVRDEYELVYNDLCKYKDDESVERGGVVVTGQPGIGKTCFLYYLLFRLLSEKKSVAFQVNEAFVLFEDTGVSLSNNASAPGQLVTGRTWALTDSHTNYEKPCTAFLAGDTWVVQTTSPSTEKWQSWHKELNAVQYWMDVFSLDEIIALGTICHLDINLLRKNYHQWGPSARTCITLRNPVELEEYRLALTSSAYSFTKNFGQFEVLDAALMSHRLIVVRPNRESRQDVTVEFASERPLAFISRAYAQRDSAVRRGFYNAMSRHAWFSASAGYILRSSVLLWLRHPPARDYLPCVPAENSSPLLKIPACRDKMEFFTKADDLKDVDQHSLPKCLVPVSQTFPTLDAIVITTNFIITMQMTVFSAHDAKDIGFQKVYDNLPSMVRTGRTRCHVFVTDSNDKAKSLREQRLTTPANILVYSAFVDVGQLDSIITTRRMEELENAIEHAQEMDTSQ